jgi:hypothetical protein
MRYPPHLDELDVDVGHGKAAVGAILPAQGVAVVVDQQELVLDADARREAGLPFPFALAQVVQPLWRTGRNEVPLLKGKEKGSRKGGQCKYLRALVESQEPSSGVLPVTATCWP